MIDVLECDECDACEDLGDTPVIDGPLQGKYVQVVGWRGVAWVVQSDDGVQWVQAVMVGDDRIHKFDRDDCRELPDDAFCADCGQLGCCWGC